MSVKTWETIKIQFCDHVEQQVGLEVEIVYPPEWLPDQAARIISHRCSHGMACNLDGRASCVWAGTNPNYDPFSLGK